MEEWDGSWPELEDGQTVDAVLNQPLVRHAVMAAEDRGYKAAMHAGHSAQRVMMVAGLVAGGMLGLCAGLILS